VAEYEYDGRGRRIVKLTYSGGTLSETRHFYYSNDWQILEERVGSSTSASLQYVWGIRYVDELICRDASSTRLYALQDANFNLTAITDDAGAVHERYVFYPYGQRLIYDASWSPRGSSSFTWLIGHQGLFLDGESGLYYNRTRLLHPLLGSFLQRDPLGFADLMNLYEYLLSAPLVFTDAPGLQGQITPVAIDPDQAFVEAMLRARFGGPFSYGPGTYDSPFRNMAAAVKYIEARREIDRKMLEIAYSMALGGEAKCVSAGMIITPVKGFFGAKSYTRTRLAAVMRDPSKDEPVLWGIAGGLWGMQLMRKGWYYSLRSEEVDEYNFSTTITCKCGDQVLSSFPIEEQKWVAMFEYPDGEGFEHYGNYSIRRSRLPRLSNPPPPPPPPPSPVPVLVVP
jgi:RHS repeat-associated protein